MGSRLPLIALDTFVQDLCNNLIKDFSGLLVAFPQNSEIGETLKGIRIERVKGKGGAQTFFAARFSAFLKTTPFL